MSINRIGSGVPSVQPPAVSSSGPAQQAQTETFNVRSATAAPAEAPRAVTPLDRLRTGELDVHGYIDAKVNEATEHLHGLRPSDKELIESTLRERMATEPALVALLERARG